MEQLSTLEHMKVFFVFFLFLLITNIHIELVASGVDFTSIVKSRNEKLQRMKSTGSMNNLLARPEVGLQSATNSR